VSTAEKLFETAKTLPHTAQHALLQMAQLLAHGKTSSKDKTKLRFTAATKTELEKKIGEGLDDLNSGNAVSGKMFAEELKTFRAKRRRTHA
jgi:hypothetical protein